MNRKDDDDLEPEPTAEERAEAEALARALEPRGAGATPPPDDALGAAVLLRHARRDQDAQDARIAAAAARALPAVDRRRPRRRWLVPAVLFPAGAVVALLVAAFALTARERGVPVNAALSSAVVIPAPPVTLLEAQAQAARAGADLAALDRKMRAYRAAYYAALGGGAEEP